MVLIVKLTRAVRHEETEKPPIAARIQGGRQNRARGRGVRESNVPARTSAGDRARLCDNMMRSMQCPIPARSEGKSSFRKGRILSFSQECEECRRKACRYDKSGRSAPGATLRGGYAFKCAPEARPRGSRTE